MLTRWLILLALFLYPLISPAQGYYRADTVYHITLRDGSRIKGRLVNRENNNFTLRAINYGTITILKDSIRHIRTNPGFYNNDVFHKTNTISFPNPWGSHYFVASSAIPMKKGELTFQNSELYYNKINYGISSHLSVGGVCNITSAYPLTGSNKTGPLLTTDTKIAGSITSWLHLGAKAMVLITRGYYYTGQPSPFYDDFSYETYREQYTFAGIAEGITTIGNENNNLSVAAGYFRIQNTVKKLSEFNSGGPVFSISGTVRVSPHLSFISETWVAPQVAGNFLEGSFDEDNIYYSSSNPLQYDYITAYGIRIIDRKIAFDFGLANNEYIVKELAIGLPYFGFIIKFNGGKQKGQ